MGVTQPGAPADSPPDHSRRRGGWLIGRVARSMGRVFEGLMKECGLGDIGSGEGGILYALWKTGPLRQKELAAKVGIDKSTLALTLSRMEAKGLVSRGPAEEDRRGIVVSISPSARSRVPAFEEVSRRMNQRFYTGLDEAQIDAFEATLELILRNLEGGR